MTMKKIILLGLFLCAVISAPAVATITITPSMGSDWTYQEWNFTTAPPSMTGIEADVDQNPFGTPTADVALTGTRPVPGWYEKGDESGHTGILYGNTATIDLEIPNFERPKPWYKIIQVEVTYHVNNYVQGQNGYIDALSYVTAGGTNYPSVSYEDLESGLGWRDVTITWNKLDEIPQLPVELIHLYFTNSGVGIDRIVVATVCIPEPATLLLLGGAGLIGLLRRRKAL